MSIKRTILKAGFITLGAALGITGSVYALDKFEDSYRKNENSEILNEDENDEIKEENEDIE